MEKRLDDSLTTTPPPGYIPGHYSHEQYQPVVLLLLALRPKKSHVFAAPRGKNQRKISVFGFCFSGATWGHFVFESSEMGETTEKSAFLRGKNAITHQLLKGFSALNVSLVGVGVSLLIFRSALLAVSVACLRTFVCALRLPPCRLA